MLRMHILLSLAAALAAVSLPAVVHADAIPRCPAGQHVVMNPVPPHAMHHSGGHCEPDAPRPPPPHPRPRTTPPPPAPPSRSNSY